MMMSTLLVSLYEFKQFLQIVLWIALPGTLIAVVITTYLHYRRKKKNEEFPDENEFQLALASSTEGSPERAGRGEHLAWDVGRRAGS